MYTVDQSPGRFFCLHARDNVATWGADQCSSGLRMADGAAGSVMLVATGPVNVAGGTVNVSFARLSIHSTVPVEKPMDHRWIDVTTVSEKRLHG